ncbi:NACHT domain-containing protein [Dactylosporangium sp. NPDC051541]|uniref:NACHT domain-containing protein n=1 Tax=Dactylosporangium sp. NPDC051541 TaxID=3363977 RepID=UPI0037A7BB45
MTDHTPPVGTHDDLRTRSGSLHSAGAFRSGRSGPSTSQIFPDGGHPPYFSIMQPCRLHEGTGLIVTDEIAKESLPSAYADARLSVQSIRELLSNAMDFTSYLNALTVAFKESPDGIAQYYVPPQTTSKLDLNRLIERWIESRESEPDDLPGGRPVAILGAYGIGKSSFATFLAATAAQRALKEPLARKPVLIKLGDVAGEQSLEGLLGKHFTATNPVSGYRFDIFQSLNASGGLLVILDGFDEMKQLLSWREFKYNLGQLNRLCSGNAKVVLLGRPTAFENDEQHRYALHGIKPTPVGHINEQGWPDYTEVEIAPLQRDRMMQFLTRYLGFRNSRIASDASAMEVLWQKVNSPQLRDISRRPVQLRMLAEILPTYKGELATLDLAAVYDIFIDRLISEVIEREETKHSRLAFSGQERRRFLADFAYWLWTTRGVSADADRIPDALFAPFIKEDDLERTRRDLIAGSPLDRRSGERIRFPHRSFQEFLVAERLWAKIVDGTATMETVESFVTRDVAIFLSLLRSDATVKAAMKLLPSLRGSHQWHVVDALFMDERIVKGIHEKFVANSSIKGAVLGITGWELLLLTAWATRSKTHDYRIKPDLVVGVTASGAMVNRFLGLFCALRLAANGSRADAAILTALNSVLVVHRNVERFSKEQVANRAIVQLDDTFVATSGGDRVRLGRYAGPGRIAKNGTKQTVAGNETVEVQWYFDESIALAKAIQFTKGARHIAIRAAMPIVVQQLKDVAFFSDWLGERSIHASVPIQETVDLGTGSGQAIPERLMSLRRAVQLADDYAMERGLNGPGATPTPDANSKT